MWLFTKHGFFSVVKKKFKKDDKPYQIRARVKNDLHNLIDRCSLDEDIIDTSNSDYRYRITVDRVDLNRVMDSIVDDLDYSNFKSMVHGVEDQKDKMNAYYKVWQAMYELQ